MCSRYPSVAHQEPPLRHGSTASLLPLKGREPALRENQTCRRSWRKADHISFREAFMADLYTCSCGNQTWEIFDTGVVVWRARPSMQRCTCRWRSSTTLSRRNWRKHWKSEPQQLRRVVVRRSHCDRSRNTLALLMPRGSIEAGGRGRSNKSLPHFHLMLPKEVYDANCNCSNPN